MYRHTIMPVLLGEFEGPMPFFTHLMNFEKRFKDIFHAEEIPIQARFNIKGRIAI